MDKLPIKDENNDFSHTVETIKSVLDITPKYDEITYDQLINFLFDIEKKNYFDRDNKIDYLLKFLNLKLKKLADIKTEYMKDKKK